MDPKSNQIGTMSAAPSLPQTAAVAAATAAAFVFVFSVSQDSVFFFFFCFALPCLHTGSKLPKMICFVWPQTWPHCAAAAQWAALSLPWTCSSYNVSFLLLRISY